MTSTVYYMICAVLTLGVLVGIAMMSKVPTAVKGNLLSAGCTLAAVLVTLYRYDILSDWLLIQKSFSRRRSCMSNLNVYI